MALFVDPKTLPDNPTHLECTSSKGMLGNEDLECKQGKLFTPFLGMKAISTSGAGANMFEQGV